MRRINDVKNDDLRFKPLQIEVTGSPEDAIRKFKVLVQRDGVLSKFKEKQSYEKPSDKKRRKMREATERRLATERRNELIQSGEWEKRYLKRQQKKQQKLNDRSSERKPND